jgi:hypothetical protein
MPKGDAKKGEHARNQFAHFFFKLMSRARYGPDLARFARMLTG